MAKTLVAKRLVNRSKIGEESCIDRFGDQESGVAMLPVSAPRRTTYSLIECLRRCPDSRPHPGCDQSSGAECILAQQLLQ